MPFTDSPLTVFTQLSPNQGGPRGHEITRITPHCVVGQCTAEALGNWFSRPSVQASSNYGIDKDGRVGLYVHESNRAWTSSSTHNDDRAVTIECASDTFDPYAFRVECWNTLIKLCADICRRNGKDRLVWLGTKEATEAHTPEPGEMLITVHRWYASDGRSCPGPWLFSRLPELADKVTALLNKEDDMTQAQFHEMLSHEQEALANMVQAAIEDWANTLNDNDAGQWSKEAREWAIREGLIKGVGKLPDGSPNYAWEAHLTREQLIAILYRIQHQEVNDTAKTTKSRQNTK